MVRKKNGCLNYICEKEFQIQEVIHLFNKTGNGSVENKNRTKSSASCNQNLKTHDETRKKRKQLYNYTMANVTTEL